jgi:DNA polymerase IV
MTDEELAAKEAYFNDQALLDLSDDECDVPDEACEAFGRAIAEAKPMPRPTLGRQPSSFLGPTPKERQAEFEAHATKQRAGVRETSLKLVRSSTAPEKDLTKSFPITEPRIQPAVGSANKLKRVASLPDTASVDQTSFYKQVGVIPREMRNGKNVKPASNIKLDPEPRQLLKGKIVYFYPNDDISMSRRMRIHKIIQLGAAWVNRWREDVTHVILDESTYTYAQLLRHLNKAGFSVSTILRRISPVLTDESVGWCWSSTILIYPNAYRSVNF